MYLNTYLVSCLLCGVGFSSLSLNCCISADVLTNDVILHGTEVRVVNEKSVHFTADTGNSGHYQCHIDDVVLVENGGMIFVSADSSFL